MRIATSTIYNQQVTSIDNLSFNYQNIGKELSTGKSLVNPGSDPTVIGQDLSLAGTIAGNNGDVNNAQAASNELTFVDSTLSGLTDVMQKARALLVSSATDVIPNGVQRQDQAKQVVGMLQQVIGLANSQYGNKYVFSGTAPTSLAPITPQGSPPTGVIFTGNNDQTSVRINGQNFPVGVTMQQAFNLNATDGTLSAFQVLANLYQTMNTGAVVDQSGEPVNQPGQTIYGPASPAPTTLGQLTSTNPQLSNVVLQPDSNGQFAITINSQGPAGTALSTQFNFTAATAIDDGTAASVVGQINAANIGVSAAWNVTSQRLVLTSLSAGGQAPFNVQDVPSAGPPVANNTSNFLSTFHLQGQGDTINNLSTQIGDVDAVLNNILKTRADVGQRIQSLGSQSTQLSGQATDNTNNKSKLEDTDVAKATSAFTQVQTALQAAYAVTTRIEGKSLMDYLPPG
jgi:flagellar hook-associated protein 3 FlgL